MQNTTYSQADRATGERKLQGKRRSPERMRSFNAPETFAIRALSRFSLMTPDQLAFAMRRSKRVAQDALKELRHNDLVCCGGILEDDYTIHRQTKPTPVYSLNRNGVTFVEKNNCSFASFGRKPMARSWSDKLIPDPEIKHKIGIVDCMMALCRSVEEFAEIDLTYLDPDFIKDSKRKSVNQESYKSEDKVGAERKNLIPDVIASVIHKSIGTDQTFYIEFDRGTEPVWMSSGAKQRMREREERSTRSKENGASVDRVIPIADRFINYNTFFKGRHTKTSDTNPALLWVCESDDALRRIVSSNKIQWSKTPEIANRTLLATIDDVRDDFLRANWRVPGSDEVKSVTNLMSE